MFHKTWTFAEFSISTDIFSSQSIPAWQSYLAEIESDYQRKGNIGTLRSSSSSYFYPDTLRKNFITFVSWGHCWSFKSVPTIGSGRVSLPRAVAFFMPPSIRLWTVSWIKSPEKWRLNDPRTQEMSVIKCYQHLPATMCCLLQWITCAQSKPSSCQSCDCKVWMEWSASPFIPAKCRQIPRTCPVFLEVESFFFTPKKAPNGWVSKYLEGELCQVNSQWTLDFSSIY